MKNTHTNEDVIDHLTFLKKEFDQILESCDVTIPHREHIKLKERRKLVFNSMIKSFKK